jgi:hypothetical protein
VHLFVHNLTSFTYAFTGYNARFAYKLAYAPTIFFTALQLFPYYAVYDSLVNNEKIMGLIPYGVLPEGPVVTPESLNPCACSRFNLE